MQKTLRFVWFWTFWHWSKESSRAGLFPRGPLAGISAHWDEWFQQRASEEDRRAIEEAGRNRAAQTQFIIWVFRHWAPESDPTGNRLLPRFVLGQLAILPPFTSWETLARYRGSYGAIGVPSVILGENSLGEARDVRALETLILPSDDLNSIGKIETEGFKTDGSDLRIPHRLAGSLLAGKASAVVLALWLVGGRRPHRRWIVALLGCGWLSLAVVMLRLLLGPDPGEDLAWWCAGLLGGWIVLGLVATLTAASQAVSFFREGRAWARHLARSQTRLRMSGGGLTVRGGSAGLAMTLNTLLATYRAYPRISQRSSIWRSFFRTLDCDGRKWAATGLLTETGWIKPVVLEPKLRACLRHSSVEHALTPRQQGATRSSLRHLTETLKPGARGIPEESPGLDSSALGFADETPELRVHRCRHVANAILSIGGMGSSWQIALTLFGVAVSMVLFAAIPDLRSALLPASPPAVIAPASSSPYSLWVSLDTRRPDEFEVVLESRFWTNRRVNVTAQPGANASNRAEIRLLRLSRSTTNNPEDGVVWIERRRKFLTREYAPGERVGQYSLPYLNRLGRD